ncbi:MAG TPA: hypothetical protein DCS93_32935 [Microscillaceae bacterium]|nr:hypothetical protein [Microscillaceae bacterium]
MNLHNKKFRAVANHEGLSSDETIFQYYQQGKVITGRYRGGKIAEGFIVGKQTSDQAIELLFQCLTTEGELLSGASQGTLTLNQAGKIEIHFDWQWFNGDQSGGKSHYVEVIDM